jgi:hypothetical protein
LVVTIIVIIIERNIEIEVLCMSFCILDLQLGAKINPAAGCTGRGEREKERERIYS